MKIGTTLLCISNYILYRVFLSLPSPRSGYRRREERIEKKISEIISFFELWNYFIKFLDRSSKYFSPINLYQYYIIQYIIKLYYNRYDTMKNYILMKL